MGLAAASPSFPGALITGAANAAAPAAANKFRRDSADFVIDIVSFRFITLFKNRLIEPELLDHADPEEARVNLADLVRINRRFGGYSTAAKLLSRVVQPNERFTMLDVGAASGDTGRYLSRLYPNARITSLDYNQVNVEAASRPKLIADAFALPFRFQTFDFVFSSLFLHHFSDEQVVDLMSGFYSIASRAVLITDLERHIVPYYFLPATKPFLKWNRITVHDGVISVRAAFTRRELEKLGRAAGMARVRVESHRPAFRLSLVGLKQRSL